MVFDSEGGGAGDHHQLAPMQIAHNSLFTAREKIELLQQLKANVTGAQQEGSDVGFDAEEIDAAIAEVRQDVANGMGSETILNGDP